MSLPGSEILSIAALDSSGGAGLNQDIRVCSLLGARLRVACSGITIQSETGVEAIHPVSAHLLREQLLSIFDHAAIDWVKIGAICAPQQIGILLETLSGRSGLCLILDPVFKPSRGLAFLPQSAIPLYRELLGIASYLSPNYSELEALTEHNVNNLDSALEAARILLEDYDLGILLKGGHGDSGEIREAYISRKVCYLFSHPRSVWHYSHGTGCALASAFSCFLARGIAPQYAFEQASLWVADFYTKLNADIV